MAVSPVSDARRPARTSGHALLPHDDPVGAGVRRRLVAAAGRASPDPRRPVDRDRPARRPGRVRCRPDCAAGRVRGDLRRLPGGAARAPGRRRPARLSPEQRPQRPVDVREPRPRRHRAPRARRPHQRPGDGARLRPRLDRPADVHEHGLHRAGARHAARRHRVGAGAVRLHLVGSAAPARRLGVHPLAAPRERRLARPQHRRGEARPAPHQLRLRPRHRARCGQGGPPLRAGAVAARALHPPSAPPPRPPVRSDPPPREVAHRRPGDRARRQRRAVRRPRPSWVRRQPRPPVRRHLRRRGVRGERHRVRRAQLGARRRLGTGRLDRAPRDRDGRRRRALGRSAAPSRHRAGRPRSGSATSRSPTRPAAGRCSTAST